jgi:hypothetical protein
MRDHVKVPLLIVAALSLFIYAPIYHQRDRQAYTSLLERIPGELMAEMPSYRFKLVNYDNSSDWVRLTDAQSVSVEWFINRMGAWNLSEVYYDNYAIYAPTPGYMPKYAYEFGGEVRVSGGFPFRSYSWTSPLTGVTLTEGFSVI